MGGRVAGFASRPNKFHDPKAAKESPHSKSWRQHLPAARVACVLECADSFGAFATVRTELSRPSRGRLDNRLDRLQVGILFREFAKSDVHLEAGLQVLPRVMEIAEKGVVTAH